MKYKNIQLAKIMGGTLMVFAAVSGFWTTGHTPAYSEGKCYTDQFLLRLMKIDSILEHGLMLSTRVPGTDELIKEYMVKLEFEDKLRIRYITQIDCVVYDHGTLRW